MFSRISHYIYSSACFGLLDAQSQHWTGLQTLDFQDLDLGYSLSVTGESKVHSLVKSPRRGVLAPLIAKSIAFSANKNTELLFRHYSDLQCFSRKRRSSLIPYAESALKRGHNSVFSVREIKF